MQREERRKHPGVRVPEDVAVVARAREPHRRDALVRALTHAREQIEQHRMDHPLQLGISLYHDVRFPQAMPRRDVLGEQHAVAAGGGTAVRGSRLRQWVRPIPRRRDADELRERDGLAGRRIEGDLRGAPLHVPQPPRRRHRLRYSDSGGPAFDLRRERDRVSGRHDHAAWIPHRVLRPLRLVPLEAREREPAVRRPLPQRESQRHAALVPRYELQPHHGEVGVGAGDEGRDLDRRALRAVYPVVRRPQGAVIHVERLAVRLQHGGIGRDVVEPPVAVGHIDLVPSGERRDPRHVIRGVVVDPRGEREGAGRAERRGDEAERAVADEGGGAVGRVGRRQDEAGVLGRQRGDQEQQQRASHRDRSVSDGWLARHHAAVTCVLR